MKNIVEFYRCFYGLLCSIMETMYGVVIFPRSK